MREYTVWRREEGEKEGKKEWGKEELRGLLNRPEAGPCTKELVAIDRREMTIGHMCAYLLLRTDDRLETAEILDTLEINPASCRITMHYAKLASYHNFFVGTTSSFDASKPISREKRKKNDTKFRNCIKQNLA